LGISAAALLVTTNLSTAQPAYPDILQQKMTELFGLRKAPEIPVRSIILRHDLPDHVPSMQTKAGKPVSCDKDVDLTTTASGVIAIAAQDNIICTNADIDMYSTASSTYVVQAGGDDAAWTHTNVTNPANPSIVGQFIWVNANGKPNRHTYTPDVKTFRQGVNDYIVMGLERRTLNGFCGITIVNVSDPANPVIESQYIGFTSVQDFGPFWCDTHNVFVEDDANGNGQYIYATADGPNDMRVLDISGTHGGSVSAPVEIGRYVSPTANNDNYVHDITVINHGNPAGRRAYLAYWDSGTVILNATHVTPGTVGTNPTPIVGPNELDPENFLTHHAFASQDGSLVFTQDEFLTNTGDEPVQMWDVSNPSSPIYVDGVVLGTDVPVNPAHNLEIRFDIDPDRLYVGWYKLGLQAWDFTSTGFNHSANPTPRTAVQYHQAQTEAADNAYDGAWSVRLENITVAGVTNLYIFQSDRNFGLIVDCVGCTQTTGTIQGTVTDSSTGNPIEGTFVSTDTAQSDTTDVNGDYTLGNVPTGDRTVEALASGYITQQKTTTVTDGGTSTVDFALDPEPTGSAGTIKGTVTDDNTGARLRDVTVITDTGQSATTNKRGMYRIKKVPEGERTVTASKAGYTTQSKPATVVTDQTTIVDFALVP